MGVSFVTFVGDEPKSQIFRFDRHGEVQLVAGNGAHGFCADGPATQICLGSVFGIAIEPRTGELYFADTDNQLVRKVDAAGNVVTVAGNGSFGYSGDGGPALDASFAFPSRPAFDLAGNLYVGDYGNRVVREIATSGTVSTVAGGGGRVEDGGGARGIAMGRPERVAFDGAGNLYVLQFMLDFAFGDFDGNLEGVVWRLNADLPLAVVAPLALAQRPADVILLPPASDIGARASAQLLDPVRPARRQDRRPRARARRRRRRGRLRPARRHRSPGGARRPARPAAHRGARPHRPVLDA